MGNKKYRRDKCQVNVITGVLRLIKRKVPVLLIWQSKGKVMKVGSENVSKWYEDLEPDLKNDLRAKMVQDIVMMNNNSEEIIVNAESIPDGVKAKSVFKDLRSSSASSLPRLPFPLSLMSKKQKVKFICDRIAEEARAAGVKLSYGSESWRPSFWPETTGAWTNLNQTLS